MTENNRLKQGANADHASYCSVTDVFFLQCMQDIVPATGATSVLKLLGAVKTIAALGPDQDSNK